jgi:hypothetical protein
VHTRTAEPASSRKQRDTKTPFTHTAANPCSRASAHSRATSAAVVSGASRV